MTKLTSAMSVMRIESFKWWKYCVECYYVKRYPAARSRFGTGENIGELHHAYRRSAQGPVVCENFNQLAPLHRHCHRDMTTARNNAIKTALCIYAPLTIPQRFTEAFARRQEEWKAAKEKLRTARKKARAALRKRLKPPKPSKWAIFEQ